MNQTMSTDLPISGPSLESQRQELARLIELRTGRDGTHPCDALPALCLYRSTVPGEPTHALYKPSLCVMAQGSKQVLLGEAVYRYDPAHYLLTSVDLPVVGQVTKATTTVPYLALSLDLDLAQIGTLLLEVDLPRVRQAVPPRGIAVSTIDGGLLDAVLRLLRLLQTRRDLRVLAPLAIREILYRLLIGEQGPHLCRIAAENSETQRIVRAIQWLRQHYTEPIRIGEIARIACMSPSGLHHHFKAVTAMTPLQYQKQLRLQEARRLMLGDALDAATASYRVGYESPSQFSREYRRLFGAPPQRDIANLRPGSPERAGV